MKNRYYILNEDHGVMAEKNPVRWANWFISSDKSSDTRVAFDQIGDKKISTGFIGIDHNFGLKGPPLLFETMIFEGEVRLVAGRYSTWNEAITGHREAISKLTSGMTREELEAAKTIIEPLLKG